MPARVQESQRKRPANLSISPHCLRFGQGYAEANQTSLSQVVEDLLGALEQTMNLGPPSASVDPLDGMLVGWPQLDKKELRRSQQEARLSR